ncbi:MAG: alpha/beta hydrolase [Candidatus Izemoplasma sp.]|nr:alpha/beta hydrolase [Candidatus Izemoplasma sp.]
MIRPNVDLDTLEDEYFTEHSHYIDVSIEEDNTSFPVQIHYQDLGALEDPVILLIHGSFSSSHTFLPWANSLVEKGYRVIMPDLPYFGLSEGFSDHITSYERSAKVIKYLLDTLNIDKVEIADNSLGGAVAWYFTSDYESYVRTLTLIDAVYPQEIEDNSKLKDTMKNEWLAELLSLMTPRFIVKRFLLTAYGNDTNMTEDILDRYYDLLRKDGTRKSILINTRVRQTQDFYEEKLSNIIVPKYIMWGKKDSWISVETVNLFQDTMDIPEKNIIIYDDLGHVPMEENPSDTLLDFLSFIE